MLKKETKNNRFLTLIFSVFVLAVSSYFLTGCSSSGTNTQADAQAEIQQDVDLYMVDSSGGDGGEWGNRSGKIEIKIDKGSLGRLEILESGSVDASFSPSERTVNLGDNPLTIATDTTIYPCDGDYPCLEGCNIIDSDDDEVTGIRINEDVELVISNNGSTVEVCLINDMDNHGTLTTDDGEGPSELELYVASYFGNSSIDQSGDDCENGAKLKIDANYSVLNSGSINTSGGNCDDGSAGDAGKLEIKAFYVIENSGELTAVGGTSTYDGCCGGGDGKKVKIESEYGSIYNSGAVSTQGGSGSSGGDADKVEIKVKKVGNLINSGDLTASGGTGNECMGGKGKEIKVEVKGGNITSNGNMVAAGGSSSGECNGAKAGKIKIEAKHGDDDAEGVPAGSIELSGNLTTTGGASESMTGGEGGEIKIKVDAKDAPAGQNLTMRGYASLNSNGGAGTNGGNAWGVSIRCRSMYIEDAFSASSGSSSSSKLGFTGPSCTILNQADINSMGGDAAVPVVLLAPGPIEATSTNGGATGGHGGNVEITTEYEQPFDNLLAGVLGGSIDPSLLPRVVNSGNIDATSGDNLGVEDWRCRFEDNHVLMFGFFGVDNSGKIDVQGGDDNSDDSCTGVGSPGGWVGLYAELGGIDSNGEYINTSGGYGNDRGGDADTIQLFGAAVNSNAVLMAKGGGADAVECGSGGQGSCVELYSPEGMLGMSGSVTTADVSGGSADEPGDSGSFIRGGQLVEGDGDDCGGLDD